MESFRPSSPLQLPCLLKRRGIPAVSQDEIDKLIKFSRGSKTDPIDQEMIALSSRWKLGTETEDFKAGLCLVRDAYGIPVLFHAAHCGSLEVIRALLVWGFDPNAQYRDPGDTPFTHAISVRRSFEIVTFLAERSTDLGKANDQGKTGIVMAAEFGDRKLVDWFLTKGVERQAKKHPGRTADEIRAEWMQQIAPFLVVRSPTGFSCISLGRSKTARQSND
ncbi:hypothetical protein GGTG_09005 [Gaeumannomyces tritici R3-111a-1]|uniref:Uncharacterized protein n=1 Tax=Gaeumannomyces tritici (strain R3-111a-1) TaxID=644352 RepID=J3P665_GAET3|nr:hypothetical protein GGTG_09005 [Gaeumannomyces tritici R3-111a-1]EJT72138.1 hypothetical protein GGTG_09005 [Gaeumannomyces tritici R3-111a-1]